MKLSEHIYQLPFPWADLLREIKWLRSDIGMTAADVYMSEEFVLKIMPNDDESAAEQFNYSKYQSLGIVPQLFHQSLQGKCRYLLIERIKGHTLDEYPIHQRFEYAAQLLQKLWSLPHEPELPIVRYGDRLKKAANNIACQCVDMNEWDRYFHPLRFDTPQAMLDYLSQQQFDEDLVFSHGDLTFDNVLLSNNKMYIIDLGRIAWADRYQDLALLSRSLYYSGCPMQEIYEWIRMHLSQPLNQHKLLCYMLLDEL